MKLVILAGGLETRLSEETQLRPKPMVEIGGKPILWHILKIYKINTEITQRKMTGWYIKKDIYAR